MSFARKDNATADRLVASAVDEANFGEPSRKKMTFGRLMLSSRNGSDIIGKSADRFRRSCGAASVT